MQKIYRLYFFYLFFLVGILGVGISNAYCTSGNFTVPNPVIAVDCKQGSCLNDPLPSCANTSLCGAGCGSLGIVRVNSSYYVAVSNFPENLTSSSCSSSGLCGHNYAGGNHYFCKSTISCTTLAEATAKNDSLTGNAISKCTAWSCSVKDHIEYGTNSITGYKIATYTCTAGSSSMIGMTRSTKSGSCSASGPPSTDSLVTEGAAKAQYQCTTSYSNGVPTAKMTCIGGACYTGGISISGSTCEDQGYKEGGGKNGDYSSSGASGSGSGSGTSIYQDSTVGTTGSDATGGSYRCVASIRDGVEYATFYYSDGSHSTVSGTCGNGNTANGTSTSPDAPDTVSTGVASGQLDYSAYLSAIINNQLVQSSYLYTLNETSSGILGAITQQTLNDYTYFSGLNTSLNSANTLQTAANSLQTTTNNTLSTISSTLSSEKTKIDSVLITDKLIRDTVSNGLGAVNTWLQTIHEDLLSFSMPSSSVQSSSSISSSSVQSSSSISSSSVQSSSSRNIDSLIQAFVDTTNSKNNSFFQFWNQLIDAGQVDSLPVMSRVLNRLDSLLKHSFVSDSITAGIYSLLTDLIYFQPDDLLNGDSIFSDSNFMTVDTTVFVPTDSFSTFMDSISMLRDSLQVRADSVKFDSLAIDTFLTDTAKYRQQFSFMFWSNATPANGTCFVLNLPFNSLPFLSNLTASQTQVDLGNLAGCNLCKIAGFILKLLTLLDVGFMYFFMFKNIFSNPL